MKEKKEEEIGTSSRFSSSKSLQSRSSQKISNGLEKYCFESAIEEARNSTDVKRSARGVEEKEEKVEGEVEEEEEVEEGVGGLKSTIPYPAWKKRRKT